MEEDYLVLGRMIARQCPAGFQRARLEAELDEDWADLRLACTLQDGSQIDVPLEGAAAYEIHLPLADIREKMAAQEGRRWRGCVVTLVEGGRFAMDLAY